jgi:hypothetical protein
MRRREFIALAGASVARPFAAMAQHDMPTLSILTTASPTTTQVVRFVVEAMKDFGWNDKQTTTYLLGSPKGT